MQNAPAHVSSNDHATQWQLIQRFAAKKMNNGNNGDNNTAQRQEELSAYEKILDDVKHRLKTLQNSVDTQALNEIIDKSTEELKQIESHSLDAVAKASDALKKDLASSAERTKPLIEALRTDASQALDTLHEAGAQIWTQLAKGAGSSMEDWRAWTGGTFETFLNQLSAASGKLGDELGRALTYRTGEMTHGGTFRCVDCETHLMLKQPGHLPPCPKCHKTAFRRA